MKKDSFDEIFGELGDDDYTPLELASEQAENICGDSDVKPPSRVFDSLPQPLGDDLPVEFVRMISKVHAMYSMFPQINHEKMYDELSGLMVKTIDTPTLGLISQELHKVQSLKERLAQIMVDLTRVHSFKKRQVEILKDSWVNFSLEKSADKRKADSVYRLSEFESDFLSVDSLWRTANHILHNLDSTQDILSRRITIVSLELKMQDLGRHSTPDYEFRGSSLGDDLGSPVGVDDENDDENDDDNEEPLIAEECEF